MQYFCAEIGQFGSFVEMEFMNRLGLLHKPGVVVMHSVDICPDFDLFGQQGATYQRGCQVAAAALKVVDFPF